MTNRRSRPALAALAVVLGVGASVAACGNDGPQPIPTVAVPTASATVTAPDDTTTRPLPGRDAVTAAPRLTPGTPCEPGSHPDCSDDTGTEGDTYRIIEGYADCVAEFGDDANGGLCTDLDGDGVAGYPDHG